MSGSPKDTATPWHIGKPSADLPNFTCIRCNVAMGAWSVAWTVDPETAKRIVQAVNSHDEMLAALIELEDAASVTSDSRVEAARRAAREVITKATA